MRLFPDYNPEYPIRIEHEDGTYEDSAGNVESAVSVLYGDLSYHPGTPRTIYAPVEFEDRLRYEARINADCWGIPLDRIVPIPPGLYAA